MDSYFKGYTVDYASENIYHCLLSFINLITGDYFIFNLKIPHTQLSLI